MEGRKGIRLRHRTIKRYTQRVGTFTELNALGWCGPEANDIDNHRVPTIGEQRPDPVRTMKWIESLPTGK